MAQLIPTTIEYGKIVALVKQFQDSYTSGEFKTPEDVAQAILDVITKYENLNGKPLLSLERFTLGEPADSVKINRIRQSIQDDINLLSSQVEVLNAATIFIHNFLTTEIELAKNQNAQASNKLKTLQLYTSAYDNNIVQFGDFFTNLDFVDFNLVTVDQRAQMLNPGLMVLPQEAEVTDFSSDVIVKILPTSNGYAGNNQEAATTVTNAVNPIDGNTIYQFKASVDGRHADLTAVLDGQPNTWFEYEQCWVSDQDRLKAKDYNFTYRSAAYEPNSTSATDVEGAAAGSGSTVSTDQVGLVDWAKGPTNNVLKLDLEFDLGATETMNSISFTPFGLANNKNVPIKVSNVQVSANGTDWEKLTPENVYVTTDANLQAARVAANIVLGSALWSFEQKEIRYIRLYCEQIASVDTKLVHVYYETKPISKSVIVVDENSPSQNTTAPEVIEAGGERVEGPIPPLSNPLLYADSTGFTVGSYIQKSEVFDGKRWAIGIRDISIKQSVYKTTGVIISKPFRIDGIVDRVSLESDIFVPAGFPIDDIWVRFFVSPDNGLNWYPISRIQDDFLGIPEIIAFNDPIPEEFREEGITYINTNSLVNQLRVKVELSRPEDLTSSSPILKSYKLKIRKR